ncbi:MAG: hypothetical protein R3243_16920, partial [Arenibacter latericius]|nr:hypothetical protein [Arenibacter latericius]
AYQLDELFHPEYLLLFFPEPLRFPPSYTSLPFRSHLYAARFTQPFKYYTKNFETQESRR